MLSYSVDYDHCKAHILITVCVVYPWGSGISSVYPLFILWWVSSRDMHTCVTVRYLSIWYLDTPQLEWFWRGELFWCWPWVMLCFLVISVSVAKLETVPILGVERLLSSLLCINASQSVIISLWRTVPVWLYPIWYMAVFIRQDYSRFVMLWFDKNKVHGFFVFLFCCSFESYTLLLLVQQVSALPLAFHKSFL